MEKFTIELYSHIGKTIQVNSRIRLIDSMLYFSGRNDKFPCQSTLIKNLFEIEGVDAILAETYQLDIKIGQLFTLEELEPQIRKAILDWFASSDDEKRSLHEEIAEELRRTE